MKADFTSTNLSTASSIMDLAIRDTYRTPLPCLRTWLRIEFRGVIVYLSEKESARGALFGFNLALDETIARPGQNRCR